MTGAIPAKHREEQKTIVDLEEYLRNPLEKFKADLKSATST